MKRIFLFLMLVCSINYAQTSQNLMLLFNENLQPETKVYVASLAIPIGATQVSRIDKFVKMLKDSLQISSLSSKFDGMYLLANETSEAGLKNLVKRQHDATAVNSPTFTQWEGFTGNGTSSYINTNYVPSTSAISYQQNNASFGIYSRSDITDGLSTLGAINTSTTSSIFLNLRTISNMSYYRINVGSSLYATVSNSTGLFIITRNNTSVKYYRNTSLIHSPTNTSNALVDLSVYIIGYNENNNLLTPDTRQYSFAFFGATLTATEVSKLTNCIEWYMDSLNRGVIP